MIPTNRFSSHKFPGFLLLIGVYLLIALVYTPEALDGTLRWDERMSEYVPWRVEQARILADGELPVFTDKIFGGMPVLAQGYTGLFYPPNLLYVWFDARLANWLAVLHTVLGGVGMFLYLRRFRLHDVAAFCGSVFFLTMTFHTLHSAHVSMRETGLLAPWVLLFTNRLMQKPTFSRAGILGLMVALQLSPGYPQAVLFTMVLAGLEVLRHVRWKTLADWKSLLDRSWLKSMGLTSLAMVLGVAALAILILPTQHTIPQTVRTIMTVDNWQEASFPPSHSVLLANPFALGESVKNYIGDSFTAEVINVTHPSALVLALLGAGIMFGFKTRQRVAILYSIAAVVFFVYSFGSYLPGHGKLFNVPILGSFRIPSRWLFISSVCVCILSAHGIHLILKYRSRIVTWTGLYGAIYGVVLGLGILLWKASAGEPTPEQAEGVGNFVSNLFMSGPNIAVYISVFVIGLSLLIFNRKRIWIGVLIIPATVFIPVIFTKHVVGWKVDYNSEIGVEAHSVWTQYPAGQFDRIYPLVDTEESVLPKLLMHNVPMFRGYRSMGGYSPLYSMRMRNVMGVGQDGSTWSKPLMLENPTQLRHYAVSHVMMLKDNLTLDERRRYSQFSGNFDEVLDRDGVLIRRIKWSRPRAEVVPSVVASDHHDDSIRFSWEPGTLETGPYPVDTSEQDLPQELINAPPATGRVLNFDFSRSRHSFKVESDAPAMFVVRDHYWKGWEYEVRQDGELVGSGPVYPVMHLLLGAPIPEGTSDVLLVFRQPGLKEGFWISVVCVGSLLMMVLTGLIGLKKCSLAKTQSREEFVPVVET